MERYDYAKRLGEGISSVVYKAMDKQRNEHVALKMINLDNEEEGIPSTALREIAILTQLQHENIVKLYDVVHHGKRLVIALEYCDLDLKEHMENFNSGLMPSSMCKSVMHQLLKAVEYIHEQNVIHRDLKPQNVLIQKDKNNQNNVRVLLADFGLARELGIHVRSCTSEVVTLWYRPPDVLCGSSNYGFSVDIWSLGCIFAEVYTGKATFPGQNETETLKKNI